MKYSTIYTKEFNKSFKRLNIKDQILTKETIWKLSNDEPLDATYKNHKLKGKLKNKYDCHIRGDLVLIYEKNEEELILTAINIGKHSIVF